MTERTPRVISLFLLVMINISAICSIRNWPLAAAYEFSSLFLMFMVCLFFFLPIAFVSAELATGWPESGGVFVWIKEAFGHQMGFLSIWYLWLTNIPWYPTLLSFIAGTAAFAFYPPLANDKTYMLVMILTLFWLATFLNLKGMKLSSQISTFGVIFGTIIPGMIIILLGITWLLCNHPLQMELSRRAFFPDLSSLNQLVLATGMLTSFAGIEMSAVHAQEVINPQKNYPRAIFLSGALIFFISALGSLSIAMVIPTEKISFVSGVLDTITLFLGAYKLSAFVPLIAIAIAIGAFGQMSTWIIGPSRGLLAAAKEGDLPIYLQGTNKKEMPLALMLLQGIIVTFLSLVFLLMPSVSSSFWLLTSLTTQFYLLMYMMMFAAAIRLKFYKADVPRSFVVPGGKVGMCLCAGIGFFTSFCAFLLGFIPPKHVDVGSDFFYTGFLLSGILLGSLTPKLLVYSAQMPSTKNVFSK
ncbi:MAG: amino acid permease [Chlamydiota bacterium]